MLSVVYAASESTEDIQAVAALQAELLKQKIKTKKILRNLLAIENLRRKLNAVSGFISDERCSLTENITPQAIPHGWTE